MLLIIRKREISLNVVALARTVVAPSCSTAVVVLSERMLSKLVDTEFPFVES